MTDRSNKRPNILLVLTDQHAASIAGFSGDPEARTQHLDALAARSVQFDCAVSPSPLCTPARMCLLTAKEPHRCAAWQNHWAIFPEHITWPAHFAAHGYRTCLVGKMHFGGRDQMQGFMDRPYGDLRHGLGHQPDPLAMFPGYAGARSAGVTEIPESLLQENVVTRETLAYVQEHTSANPEAPWFVCASYSRPHPPFTTPGRYFRRYRGRVRVPEAGTTPPDEEYARRYARRFSDLTSEEIQRGREGYYACVDFVDDCIGELLSELQVAGALENTIIIYTSDHGEMLGNHGLWAKVVYYEPAMAVPMLISGPGVAGHHRVAHPVSLLDLFPTACGLAGLPVPDGLDGKDLSSLLANPAEPTAPHDAVISEFCLYGQTIAHPAPIDENAPHGAWRAVRSQGWKYVEVEKGAALLFDMQHDPHEMTNLASAPEHAGLCAQLQRRLYHNFSWEDIHRQLAEDRRRLVQFKSGQRPTTPNQYRLPDGRIFDAERELYEARWLRLPADVSGGIIPQQFG